MQRVLWVALLGFLWVALPGYQLATATELVKDGTAVSLTGAENAAKTADHSIRDWIVPLLGSVVSIGSLTQASKNPGPAAIGFVSGVGIAFTPSIIGTATTQVAAATSLAFAVPSPLGVWVQWGAQVFSEAMVFMVALVGMRAWRRREGDRYLDA